MAEYALTNAGTVIRTSDGATIPPDPNNQDWQEYQDWLYAGGVPDPAPVLLDSPQYSWGPTLFDMLGGHTYVGT